MELKNLKELVQGDKILTKMVNGEYLMDVFTQQSPDFEFEEHEVVSVNGTEIVCKDRTLKIQEDAFEFPGTVIDSEGESEIEAVGTCEEAMIKILESIIMYSATQQEGGE